MYWRPSLVLYVVFFLYRFNFWDRTLKELFNVIINSFFDTSVSLLAAWFIYSLLEKKYLKGKSPLIFIPSVVIGIIIFCFLLFCLHWVGYTVTGGMTANFTRTFSSFSFQVFDVITVVLVGTAGSYAYFKFIEADKNRRLADELRLEKQAAELQALKEQINPHFIFNSLNAIYFTVDKENEPGREMVASFADLLRYQLYECNKPLVPLENELEFIEKYLYLQRMRMNENMDIEFDHSEAGSGLLPPLLLIPLVENAIKHSGNLNSQKSIITISAQTAGNRLIFSVFNTRGREKAKELFPGSHGIGNKNVKRRLELIFNADFVLTTEEKESSYLVKLDIPLQ